MLKELNLIWKGIMKQQLDSLKGRQFKRAGWESAGARSRYALVRAAQRACKSLCHVFFFSKQKLRLILTNIIIGYFNIKYTFRLLICVIKVYSIITKKTTTTTTTFSLIVKKRCSSYSRTVQKKNPISSEINQTFVYMVYILYLRKKHKNSLLFNQNSFLILYWNRTTIEILKICLKFFFFYCVE